MKAQKKKIKNIVIIEKDNNYIDKFEEENILYILGDATEEDILIKANISKAKCVVATLGTDIDNVFLTLTSKHLNKNIFLIARAANKSAEIKLKSAGANRVECPYDIGAKSMVLRIVRPTVTNFLDTVLKHNKQQNTHIEEMVVSSSSKLVGKSLLNSNIRQDFNLIVISIKRLSGDMIFNPMPDTLIESQDTIVVLGYFFDLENFRKVVENKYGL